MMTILLVDNNIFLTSFQESKSFVGSASYELGTALVLFWISLRFMVHLELQRDNRFWLRKGKLASRNSWEQ